MENQRFVLPLTMGDKAYFVESEIRVVKNKNNKNFGKVKVYTDMQYNPLIEHASYKTYMSFESAESILNELGFIKVEYMFDQLNINDLKSIKSELPKEWIYNYNLWVNYSG